MEVEIECGFNTNDETINFGSRGIADNEPYESVTFASLRTKANSSSIPSIISKLNGDQIFFSVENLFGVFQDEEYGTLKYSLNSDHTIDDFFYCSINRYLFLFLRDGSLQILKDESGEFILLKTVQILEKEQSNDKKIFINTHFVSIEQEMGIFLIVTSDGLIFRLDLIKTDGSEISVAHTLIRDVKGTIEISTYYNSVLFLSGSGMWVLNFLTNNLNSSKALDLKYVKFAGLMILSLLNTGELVYICPVTLQQFPREFNHPISAISIINNERDEMKYITAVSMKDSSGNNKLSLLRPDFSCVYTLTIPNDIILISPESEIHEIRFISLIRANSELRELRFQCVVETDPHKRLKRLLRRNMFEEAEKFAKSENLDVNIVSKEKAKLIVEKLRINHQDVNTLINIFDSLNDHSFILDCCLLVDGTCEKAGDFLRILTYACNLEVSKKDTFAKEKQYICNRLLTRFNLFRLIEGCDMEIWNSSSEKNSIVEVKKLLKQQKLFQAITVYNHMSPPEIQNSDGRCIQEILDILNGIDLDIVDIFLPMFMSLTLEWLPSTLPIFMDWMEKKIFQLEKQHSEDFPDNAIKFLEFSSEYLKTNDQHSVQLQQEMMQIGGKVQTMSKILNKLEILKSVYGVQIAINDLMQDPKIVVRNILNLDLTMEVYNAILREFTYEYIVENNLNPDEIFFDALNDILKYQESYWSNIIGSILSSITSQDLKLKAVENMLTRAKLPWSDAVKQIGIQILKECYPKSGNVQELMASEPRMTVVNRLEYRFEGSNYLIDDLQFMVKRIIRCNLPTMISDALVLCEDKESYKIDAIRMLLHHFIETGDFENIFDILEKDETIVKKALEFVLHDVDFLSELWTSGEAQNYAHIFNSKRLIDKYCSLCKNEFESYHWKKKAYSFFMAHNIKSHFKVNITRLNISSLTEKKKLMNDIKNRIIDDYEKGTKNVSFVLESLKLLSSYMDVCIEKLLSRCWNLVKVNKNEFLFKIAEEFLNNSVKVKYICILVVYIMENLCPEDGSLMTDNSFLGSYSTEKSDEYSGRVLKLASELITKAIWYADIEEFSACLKIVSWVDSIYFINTYKKQNGCSSIFEDSLNINSLNPSFSSLLAIQNVFTLYTSFVAQFRNINHKYISYYHRKEDNMSQEVLLEKIKKFEVSLHVLNQEGESLLPYKLLTTLKTQLITHDDLDVRINEKLTNMIKKHLIPNLVQQALLMTDINVNLLYTSLMWCDSEETEKFIVRTLQYNRKIPSKVTTISAIAIKMFDFHKKIELSSYFKQVILSVSWWERLKHLNIEYDLFFKVNSEERLKLMMKSEEFDVKLINEYCKDYNVNDVQSIYLFYLKTHLLNWKPRYEIETNNIGRRKLIMKGNQQKELFQKCNDVLRYIDNKEKVEKLLKEIWSQINFYYYEVFACILDLYRDNSFKHLKLMLKFLETYERINKPIDIEVEKWFNTFPQCQFIEPLSEFRILFNNTLLESKNIWNIIRKEISLENYTKWFEAVQAFSFLNVDNICTFLVKELVAQGILKIIKQGDWVIPKHTHLFNEIETCLDYMKDDIKKITAAYLLLLNTPEGADQVTIAEIAYKYTEEYKMKANGSTEFSINKIEREYQKCLSLQILHTYKLAEQRYIDLILNIEQLLLALYHDERILRKMNNLCQYCPDINTASSKLAKIFNLDIIPFREKLLKNYLMDSQISSSEINENERSENNLKRAAYICSENIHFWHNHLWNKEYKSEQSDFYKARCVKCLLLFADRIALGAFSSMSYEAILDILDQLTLNSILSKFGMQLDLKDMKNWSIITKKLARIGSRDSVLALAQVCKILKIKKSTYWEYIIVNMDHFKMYSDIIEFLEYTKTEDYKYEKFYVEAWTNLITYTMNDLLTLSDAEMDDRISKELILVQKCPIMFLLNLEDIIGKCTELKKNRIVEVLMQYIPKD